MNQNLRTSGIDIIGDVPWGTHFCQFYQTKEDLLDILVPYFKTGLEINEFCMWVTSKPLGVEEAKEALRRAVPDLDVFIEKGQIEIIPCTNWYVKGGVFDSDRVFSGWVEKLNKALANGYDGLRLTGNTFWLEKKDWKGFFDYEAEIDRVLGNCKIIAICTYCLDTCNANEILDVVVNHEFALIKRAGKWEQIKSSKHKKVEKTLRESEEHYRMLFTNMTEGFLLGEMIYDKNGKPYDYRYLAMNPAFELHKGIKRELVLGKTALEVFHKVPSIEIEEFSKVTFSGLSAHFEIFELVNDKENSYFDIYAFSPEKGKFAVIYTDITKRKMAEEALRESEARRKVSEAIETERKRLFEVLEALPAMICLLTPDHRYAFTNHSFREKFGDCSSRHCYECCFGLNKPCDFCETYKVLKTGEPHHWEVTAPDGSVIDVHNYPFTDVDGSPLILEVNMDITQCKKTEEALRLSYINNRSLIEASLDPLVTIGSDSKIIDVNTSTELVTGYSRNELIGTDFSDYFTEPEKARKGYQEVFTKGFVSDYRLEIRHRSGATTPILYNASVFKDKSDEVISVIATAHDITELKKAEDILKSKLEELARSNAELEQFAYVSSHDLQEPLRMLSSYLLLLQKRYQGKLDEKADKYIYLAVNGAAYMQTLINDLLEFSRVATRAKEPEPTDCELVLNQTLSNLELYIKQNNATVTHDLLPEVLADNTQLVQVFQNLIANGIKFHGEKAPRIHISAEKKAIEWLFSVKDNGIGIDPQNSEKIFEVFKRLNKKEEYPGTGIGLAICKKIVERHGGHIWVESEQGKGATFYFTFKSTQDASK